MEAQTLQPEFKAPLYVAWEVTLQCNARCIHCYSESGPGVKHPGQLDTGQALKMIDELAEAGVMVLAFSGGEPLMRPDIFELIEHAVSRDLVVNVASNGALINNRMVEKLQKSGVRSVTISLDGATPELHDRIRRFPGLFQKSVNAIRRLSEADLDVVVSFTPMRLNYQDGRAVVKLASDLGAYGANMSQFVPAGRGTIDLALEPETLRDVLYEWIEMRREYVGRLKVMWHDCRVSLLVPASERDKYSGCGAGKLTARIRVDGTLTPCVFLPNSAGNVSERPFEEIWTNSPLLEQFRNRGLILEGNCGSCEHKLKCGGCRAVSMAHFGDPMKGDPSCWIHKEDGCRSSCGGSQLVSINLPKGSSK